MSLMDQLFPANHKTTFVVDHTPNFGLTSDSHIKMVFTKQPFDGIPPVTIYKSIWTCSIEAVLEYCRIVWDLFPEGKLIRVISSDVRSRNLNNWSSNQQNVNIMLSSLSLLGPPDKLVPNPNRDYSVVYGFRTAAEAMIECTKEQMDQEKSKKNNIEIQNKCRTFIITSARDNQSIDNLTSMFHNEMIKSNKSVSKPISTSIHHCHLVIINTYPDSITSEVTDRPLYPISPILDLEVHSIPASKIGIKISNLLLIHYNLASTTVIGIPMKEEQNGNSSANYDVEIYHAATVHTAISNANAANSNAKAVVAKKEGADYETIKLKWCTARLNNNLPDIHSCTTLHRVTLVDINSRPSTCLITFLLNGRSVFLEVIKQGGGKTISHVLKSYNGEIYIHTVSSGRTVFEDLPSISEGPGGKVIQYRVADFSNFMKSNLLQPTKTKHTGDRNYIEDAKEKLMKQTAYWPLVSSSTIIYNLKQYTEPLLSLMVKDNISDQEVMNCKQCIQDLTTAELNNHRLISPSPSFPRNMKRVDQYKLMWTELEKFLRSNLHTVNHCKVLQYLFESCCKLDEEKIIEKTLMRLKEPLADGPSVIRATTDSPMSPPLTQQTGINHNIAHKAVDVGPNSIMYLQIIRDQDNSATVNPSSRPQFAGRLKSIQNRNGNLFAKLYEHIDDDTDTKSVT
ncbi:integrator complex subunit 13-like [Metopolophium dirhodum]|uniref:integrator complex subunit 13-like n=1 Tax=Metopolophium dirhodum TaxID=44670 RepID=UPI00298FC1B8|nr:integrator complex subunit 13-like [Metopolophium dirhodum]XP_060858514.1 integrator complex subunit 13-like [Metopolophium dirhodum]